jgi:Sulfotransferase family
MPVFRINGKLILFVHVPKTGGSSIRQYLSRLGPRCLGDGEKVRWSRCSPQHMHAAVYSLFVPGGFYDYGFMFVRHPYSRILSEYKMRYAQWSKGSRPEGGFSRWITSLLEEYQRNPYVLDNHLRPQHEFALEGIEVFRYEEGIGALAKKLGAVLGIEQNSSWPCAMKAPDYQFPVTWQAMERLKSFYRHDFSTFGYDDSIERFLADNNHIVSLDRGARLPLMTRVRNLCYPRKAMKIGPGRSA